MAGYQLLQDHYSKDVVEKVLRQCEGGESESESEAKEDNDAMTEKVEQAEPAQEAEQQATSSKRQRSRQAHRPALQAAWRLHAVVYRRVPSGFVFYSSRRVE